MRGVSRLNGYFNIHGKQLKRQLLTILSGKTTCKSKPRTTCISVNLLSLWECFSFPHNNSKQYSEPLGLHKKYGKIWPKHPNYMLPVCIVAI